MTETPVRPPAELARDEVYRHLRDYRDAFERPPGMGWTEISGNQIIMMMSPRAQHQRISSKIARQLDSQLTGGEELLYETDLEDLAHGVLRVPDVLVVDEDPDTTGEDRLTPHSVRLVVEIVSRSNPENDHEDKVRDYARMRIPHYVIIDPRDGTALHYSAPTGHEWDNRHRYTFGETVTVADWKIDTAALPTY